MRFERGLVAALVILLIFSGQIAHMLTELRWFQSLGYSSVYATMIAARIALFLGSALAFGAVSLANLRLIRERPRYLSWIVVLISILFGLVIQFGWERALLALNAQTFAVNDPLFGLDSGFYVFTLPLLWALWYAIFFAIMINLAITAGAYLFLQADQLIFGPEERDYAEIAKSIPGRALAHMSALLGILALLFSFRFLLDRYELLYSATGVVYGAGYADVYARLPFLYIYAGAALIAAILLFAFAAGKRSARVPLIIGVIVVATAGLG
ncbi:MAG TPA: COG1615 family transporter, partial [Methanotrichaceae archaeon]|nr:COG1615 family transporter [Methanotrichaceae archaeon]